MAKRAAKKKNSNSISEVKIQLIREPMGSSGTIVNAGYFAEEYLSDLRGYRAMTVYDKMRRSDPRVTMCLSAVKNPIRSAAWSFEIPEGSDNGEVLEKQKKLCEHVFFNSLPKSWQETLNDILTLIDFGYSLFEVVDIAVIGDASFGTYSSIGALGWRSQKTIETWNLDKRTGALESVLQIADGDLQRYARMDARHLSVFSLNREGDNYEGVSLLRPVYGPWWRKNIFLKLMAIGIERYAVPTPVADIPSGKENSAQKDALVQTLKNLTSHNQNYITKPEGWPIEFMKVTFDPEKVRKVIDAENTEMSYAFLVNFLDLGSKGGSGSYALGTDLSDFFLSGIQYIGDLVCERFNSHRNGLIKRLIDQNYGPQRVYPQLAVSGINDKAGEEFAKIMASLMSSGGVKADDVLENHLRKRYNLPLLTKEQLDEREKEREEMKKKLESESDPTADDEEGDDDDEPTPPANKKKAKPKPTNKKASERRLAEKARRLISEEANSIQGLMERELEEIAETLVSDIMSRYGKLPSSSKVNAIKDLSTRGFNRYKRALADEIRTSAGMALEQARKEVPKATKTKLSEFDNLPTKTRKKLLKQAELLVSTQMADLEKAVYFQFTSSVDANAGSEQILENDLKEAAEKYVASSSVQTAAANTASFVVNETRNAFFFDEDVLEEIESFTFVNLDPVSPICQDLAGTVFKTGDPQQERFYPPLHHNCKSYLVPNLKGGRARDLTPGGLKPSKKDLEKYITLTEKDC